MLLGDFGDSCDRNRNDCESPLVCDNVTGKASSRTGTCLYPRFANNGGICDLEYLDEACVRGSYCYSDRHKVYRRDVNNAVQSGSSGTIRLGGSDPRFSLGTKIGMCRRQVGLGSLCDSPFACINNYSCIGAGGIEIGQDPHGQGSVQGPSGSLRWNVEVNDGICM